MSTDTKKMSAFEKAAAQLTDICELAKQLSAFQFKGKKFKKALGTIAQLHTDGQTAKAIVNIHNLVALMRRNLTSFVNNSSIRFAQETLVLRKVLTDPALIERLDEAITEFGESMENATDLDGRIEAMVKIRAEIDEITELHQSPTRQAKARRVAELTAVLEVLKD